MNLLLDVSGDGTLWDGQQSVTLHHANGSTATVTLALRRQIGTREAAASGGKYLADDVVWHLPASQIADRPLPGAVIVDAALLRWVVQAVQQQSWDSRYRCIARRLSIADGLDQLITLERASWSKSLSGAPVATWHLLRSDIAARVQPIDTQVRATLGQRWLRATHRIYLAEPLELDGDCRIKHGTTVLQVLGTEHADQINQLLTVWAVITPWPLAHRAPAE